MNVPFGVTYEKIGTIQRRLAWPLHKDDTLSRSGRPTGLNIYFCRTKLHLCCVKHGGTRRASSCILFADDIGHYTGAVLTLHRETRQIALSLLIIFHSNSEA